MRIGPHSIEPPIGLAPMAGVTDKPFRLLCKRMGAGLATTEMTTSDARLWTTRKSLRRMDHAGEPEPVSVQIAGYDPAMLAQAARYNADQGAQIVDINMGCPAKKVCNVYAGSALLQDEALVARICAAVVAAVEIPVTLKIRTGWNRDNRNGVRIARIARGFRHRRARRARAHARRPVRGRGRVRNHRRDQTSRVPFPYSPMATLILREKAKAVLDATRCDGLLIGRAAQGRPWIFREIAHYLATGEMLAPPTAYEVCAILCGHLEALYAFYGEVAGVRIARKHLGWYAKNRGENSAFRAVVNRAEIAVEQLRLTREYFSAPAALALAA